MTDPQLSSSQPRFRTTLREQGSPGVLTSWPVDDHVALLSAHRRELTELRGVFGELPPDA